MVKSMFQLVAAAGLLAAAVAPAAQAPPQAVRGDSRPALQDQAATIMANNDLNEDGKVDKAEIARSLASLQKSDGSALPGSNSASGLTTQARCGQYTACQEVEHAWHSSPLAGA